MIQTKLLRLSSFARGTNNSRKLLLISSGCLIVILICSVGYFSATRRVPAQTSSKHARIFPLDVEAVVNDYQINDESGEKILRFEGKRLVRRGEKFWGVRSTIIKKNFFENVKGTYSFKKRILKFSATEASWGLTGASPIYLKGNVEITVNDKKYRRGNKALIYLQTGVVEIEGDLVSIMGSGSHT
jgi:hypothetical protein